MKTRVKILGLSCVAIMCLMTTSVSAEEELLVGSDEGEASSAFVDEARTGAGIIQRKTEEGDTLRTDEYGSVDNTLIDAVIYNDVHDMLSMGETVAEQQSISRGTVGGVALSTPESDLLVEELRIEDEHRAEQATIKKKEEEEAKKVPSYFVGGYCTVLTPVKVVKNSEFTELDCMLDFGEGSFRDARIFAGVYPNYKKETLTFLPLTATFANQNKASFNGIIMTQDRSSLNIADHIDRFRMRQLVSEYGLAINDVAYRYATLYMGNLMASRVRTKVDYISVPSNNGIGGSVVQPIVTQRVAPPKVEDFFTMAGIELVSKLFALGAKNVLENTSPLFTVYKGKKVHIDGVVSFKTDGLGRKYGKIESELRQNSINDNLDYNSRKSNIIKQYKNNMQNQDALEVMKQVTENNGNSNIGGMNTNGGGYPQQPTIPYQSQPTVPVK